MIAGGIIVASVRAKAADPVGAAREEAELGYEVSFVVWIYPYTGEIESMAEFM